MSAVETFREALFGNPPDPAYRPSREGALAAFTELYDQAVIAAAVAAAGIVIVPDIAARNAFYADPDNQLKLVYVNNNNGSASDPANGVYEYASGSPRFAEGFYNGLAEAVQPLVDQAEAAAATAAALVENLPALESALRVSSESGYRIETNNVTTWSRAAGFGGVAWSVNGSDLLVGSNTERLLGGFKAYLQAGAGATRLVIKVYQRDPIEADELPGAGADDRLLLTVDSPLADVGLVAEGAMVEATLTFTSLRVSSDYAYLITAEFFDDSNGRKVIGFGQGNAPAGKPSYYQGFYRATPAAGWSAILGGVSAASVGWLYPVYINGAQLQDDINLLEQRADKLDRSFPQDLDALAIRATDGTNWLSADAIGRWTFAVQAGSDIAAASRVSALRLMLDLSPTITKLSFRVWQRPTDIATQATLPGAGADDVQLYSATDTLVDLNMVAADGYLQDALFDFTPIDVEAGQSYLFEVAAYNDANVSQGFGIWRHLSAGGALTQQQRGFYNSTGIASPACISWQLGNLVYVAGSASSTNQRDVRDMIAQAEASAEGRDVSVSGLFSRAGVASPFIGEVTLALPATGNVVDEARVLTSQSLPIPPKFYHADGTLAHANVTAVVVKDAGTNAVLVAGVDYILNPYSGVLSRAGSGANRNVKVSYHWSKLRYDLIYVDAETKALGVVAGEPRDTDAGEVLPGKSAPSQIPLFYARVADGFVVQLIPVWYLDGLVHRDVVEARRTDYANQRRRLEPILAMARRGDTIRVAFVGDSIGAQEGGVSPVGSANGVGRDRPEYFLPNIGADLVGELPLFNQGDGGGAIHTRISTNWHFCLALAALGATVEYYNHCIGGTASGAGANYGMDPVLRAAVWANNPHVLGTHYGMNETGSTDTEGNLVDLFQDAFDNGVLAVFAVGQPRPSSLKTFTMEQVRLTWRATRRAAEFFPAGSYYDPAWVVDDDFMGAMGISPLEYGAADRFHHPGIHEYRTYGREIFALVLGEC